jgi:U3 small nucleolar RNA-associated protein 19
LRALFDIVKEESLSVMKHDPDQNFYLNNMLLQSIMESICLIDSSSSVSFDGNNYNSAIDLILALYLNEYDDLRFYAYKNVPKLAADLHKKAYSKDEQEVILQNLFHLMMEMEIPPESNDQEDDDDDDNELNWFLSRSPADSTAKKARGPCHQVKAHRRVFSEAWLSFLRLPTITDEMFKQILAIVRDKLIPNMSDPRLLHGFLTDSYNIGGHVSLLALQSLFVLITKYNLDYPQFYPKLYNLIEPDCLNWKQKAKFLSLLDMFMKSTHLPGNLVAAFLKKLARVCLYAGPGSILAVLPIMHNLIRRHSSCIVLLHRELCLNNDDYGDSTSAFDQMRLSDPYVYNERDPEQSKANESCLWELLALKDHYNNTVADYVKKFQTPFEKKQIQQEVEKYLNESHETLIGKVLYGRPPKETTRLAYEKPSSAFIAGGLMEKYWQQLY